MKKSILTFFILLLVLSIKTEAKTNLIGHRGYSSAYTENTMPAFIGAYTNGFDGIELDVYETREGRLLVHHDSSIYRMTGINKKIWNLTGKDIKRYKIYREYTIPTLEEVLRMAAKQSGPILVHIKDAPKEGYRPRKSTIKKIAGLTKKYHLKDRVVVFDMKKNAGRFVGRFGLRYGILTKIHSYKKIKRLSKWAKNHKVHMIMFVNMTSLNRCPRKKVRAIKNKGLAVGIYHTMSNEDFKKVKKLNVDYAMSDYRLSK